MTKGEYLMKNKKNLITLHGHGTGGGGYEEIEIEFFPEAKNPLHIRDIDYDYEFPDIFGGNAFFLPYESAIKLANFLKELFLDKETE